MKNAITFFLLCGILWSAQIPTSHYTHGKVVDQPSGKVIPFAHVVLLYHGKILTSDGTDLKGVFHISVPKPDTYSIQVFARGYANLQLKDIFLSPRHPSELRLEMVQDAPINIDSTNFEDMKVRSAREVPAKLHPVPN
jgi:hypothetical protein